MERGMEALRRAVGRWTNGFRDGRKRPRLGLALAGGGVIGGMYEVGALAAIEKRLGGSAPVFDIYVGCSAGSVVASLLAGGIQASDLYRILDNDLIDPLNFRRNAVFAPDSFRRAASRFGRMVWAFGKNAMHGLRGSIPDMLARAERDLPCGFFSLAALEAFVRNGLTSRGLDNAFAALPSRLLIPAIDLDAAERVVFGKDSLAAVPISEAVAASSAIPGFFEPYTINGRDYVDGGVGFSGHADLAAETGVETVLVVNPLVPSGLEAGALSIRARGLYTIMEQSSRIYSQNLLTLGLATLAVRYPRTQFFLLEPPRTSTPLFGPSMGFEASRAALRYGYESTRAWLHRQGPDFLRRLLPTSAPATIAATP